MTHSLHYGLAAFEGIRCYKGERGSAIFRLDEHVDRLFSSAHIMLMKIPFSKKQIADAICETVRSNKLEECYIRPIVFVGDGDMGLYTPDNPIRVAIAAWPWGAYLGEDGLKNGRRARISCFTRDELYIAEEVFMTGTAAELTPIREVDDRQVGSGKPGPITKDLQAAFFDIVRGKDHQHASWISPL